MCPLGIAPRAGTKGSVSIGPSLCSGTVPSLPAFSSIASLSPSHQVAIRRRPTLYVINLLVPSSFLVAIDALSLYLPAESENRASFKMTLLLGYNVFLLMMNDLLPSSSTSLISMAPSTFRRRKVGWGMA